MASGVVAFLSDFGTEDYFVAACKGGMLRIEPRLTIVDVTHQVPPRDILGGALILCNCWWCFPEGTVHLAVVDPGVGTERRALAAAARGHYFVGPDNGLLDLVLAGACAEVRLMERLPKGARRMLWSEAPSSTDEPPSPNPEAGCATAGRDALSAATFHGRDLFAPAAAWIAAGRGFEALGPVVSWTPRLELPEPEVKGDLLVGQVIRVDRFGNLMTNIPISTLREFGGRAKWSFRVAGRVLERLSTTFGAVEPGEAVLYPGSAGLLEVGVNQGSAAEEWRVAAGAFCTVTRLPGPGPG